VTLKACNTVISSRINCVAYVPSHKNRRTGSSIKNRPSRTKQEDDDEQKHSFVSKEEPISLIKTTDVQTTVDSLLDIDSSDDDETSTMINNDETCSLDQTSISSQQYILLDNDFNNEQQDTREATMWLGTDDGV
jgi:hypothetical protein